MKNSSHFLLGIFSVILFSNCNQEHNSVKSDSIVSTTDHLSDTLNPQDTVVDRLNHSRADTSYELQMNGKKYELVFSHESLSETGSGDITTTVRLTENSNQDIVFSEVYEFNTVGALRNPAPNQYWFALLNSGGGSGYSASLYAVRMEPEVRFQYLLNFNELSYWKTNKTATEVLFFQAIWDMGDGADDPDFESHFSEHRQSLGIYKIEMDTVRYIDIGTTKKKYDFSENGNALPLLRKQEPALAKQIRWEDYD